MQKQEKKTTDFTLMHDKLIKLANKLVVSDNDTGYQLGMALNEVYFYSKKIGRYINNISKSEGKELTITELDKLQTNLIYIETYVFGELFYTIRNMKKPLRRTINQLSKQLYKMEKDAAR
jgi:hypothetical protein